MQQIKPKMIYFVSIRFARTIPLFFEINLPVFFGQKVYHNSNKTSVPMMFAANPRRQVAKQYAFVFQKQVV